MPKKKKVVSFDRDIEFLFEVGCLRHINRTWRQFLNPDFENLSEHTLRVVWIALLIAKHEGLEDTGKLVKMALVHDLSESRSVDVHYVSRQFATRHEEAAIQNTLSETALREEFFQLWKEAEERQTLESKIVKDADNLDVDLELKEQAARGFEIREALLPMRKHVGKTKLYTETAKKLWKEIQTANPNDWHVNSINRFNSGDWKK
jgi:putative hydrolase of HD superfamily